MVDKAAFNRADAYVFEVTGERTRPIPCSTPPLPWHIRNAYRFKCVRLGEAELLLAFVEAGTRVTPVAAKKQAGLIEHAYGLPVVFVVPQLEAWARQRFVREKVPFIAPDRQLYLPSLGLDNRDRVRVTDFDDVMVDPDRPLLTPSEQQALLYMLLRPGTVFQAEELVSALGVSAMTVSRAFRALEGRGLIRREREGRSRPAILDRPKENSWAEAQAVLTSPVRRDILVPPMEAPFLEAGLTALARRSNLAPPDHRLVAATTSAWKSWKGRTSVDPFKREIPEPGDLVVQLWAYAPEPLAEGGTVDPLSLYLSLKDQQDERVALALEESMGAVKWRN